MKKILLLSLLLILSCASTRLLSETRLAPAKKRAIVVFPDGREIHAEVVDQVESRKLGLMFREELGEDEGMLFIFEKDGFHSIWMKNCKIPLDIIWIGNDLKIVHIKHAAPPCPEGEDCPSFYPLKRSRYVLEVSAGSAERSSLKPGDKLLLLGLHRQKDQE